MSKFTDLVTAQCTEVRHPQMLGLAGFVTETEICAAPMPLDKEYTVSLNFNRFLRVCGTVPERVAIEEAERGFKKELERLVYSDLIPLVHNLAEHAYRSGDMEFREAFRQLQDEVLGR